MVPPRFWGGGGVLWSRHCCGSPCCYCLSIHVVHHMCMYECIIIFITYMYILLNLFIVNLNFNQELGASTAEEVTTTDKQATQGSDL